VSRRFTSNEGYSHRNHPSERCSGCGQRHDAAANNRASRCNVLANDTDPDGAADLAAAMIATVPAGGGRADVQRRPSRPGRYGLRRAASDLHGRCCGIYTLPIRRRSAGALSATGLRVTVTVNATENITVTRSSTWSVATAGGWTARTASPRARR